MPRQKQNSPVLRVSPRQSPPNEVPNPEMRGNSANFSRAETGRRPEFRRFMEELADSQRAGFLVPDDLGASGDFRWPDSLFLYAAHAHSSNNAWPPHITAEAAKLSKIAAAAHTQLNQRQQFFNFGPVPSQGESYNQNNHNGNNVGVSNGRKRRRSNENEGKESDAPARVRTRLSVAAQNTNNGQMPENVTQQRAAHQRRNAHGSNARRSRQAPAVNALAQNQTNHLAAASDEATAAALAFAATDFHGLLYDDDDDCHSSNLQRSLNFGQPGSGNDGNFWRQDLGAMVPGFNYGAGRAPTLFGHVQQYGGQASQRQQPEQQNLNGQNNTGTKIQRTKSYDHFALSQHGQSASGAPHPSNPTTSQPQVFPPHDWPAQIAAAHWAAMGRFQSLGSGASSSSGVTPTNGGTNNNAERGASGVTPSPPAVLGTLPAVNISGQNHHTNQTQVQNAVNTSGDRISASPPHSASPTHSTVSNASSHRIPLGWPWDDGAEALMAIAEIMGRQSNNGASASLAPEPAGANRREKKPHLGLRKEEIDSLLSYRWSASSSEEPLICVVCMCDVGPRQNVRALPCQHQFHAKCVDRWLKHNRTCPICRQAVIKNSQPQ